jgi:hypothetical protein
LIRFCAMICASNMSRWYISATPHSSSAIRHRHADGHAAQQRE